MPLQQDLASRVQLVSEPACDGLSFSFTVEPMTDGGVNFVAIHWTVTATRAVSDITLRVRWADLGWSAPPWFMIPALMYGENRPADETRFYPRFDPAVTEPREFVSSHWDFPADRGAVPGIFAFTGEQWIILVSEPHLAVTGEVRLPEYEPQVGVGFRYDVGQQHLQFSFPATDEPYTLAGSARVAPRKPVLSLAAGATIAGTVYLFEFAADKHGYAPVMELFARRWRDSYPPAELPAREEVIAAAREGIVHWHFVEAESAFLYSVPYDMIMEQIANAKGASLASDQMMVGWTSGMPVCFGLSWASRRQGDPAGIHAAHRVADKFCLEGMSPSGFFWGRYATPHPEALGSYFQGGKFNGWDGGWNPEPEMLHTRTLGEGNHFLARFIQQERAHGVDTRAWERALESNVRKILSVQQEGGTGTFGTYYQAFTGEVMKWQGCGGLMWIPALLEAGKVFGASFLEQAVMAGDYYAQNVREEYIYGAPEDVGMTPTSEDGYNAIMAYAALYEATGNAEYLELCRIAADWTFTYRKIYNVGLHPKSILGAYGFRSRGGDFASVKNNHLHMYGLICTGELYKLSAWTGNPYYREMANDHWAYCCQNIALVDGQLNGYRGFVAEQIYVCDYTCLGNSLYLHEGIGEKPDWIPPVRFRNKGNFVPITTLWCINHLLLAAEALERTGG
ncbi:MAG: hypothetical protein ACYDBB_23305 [Armatimonadota bacterium]